MANLTHLQRALNLVSAPKSQNMHLPRFVLMSDDERLPDPSVYIPALPPGSAVILRHRDTLKRIDLAKRLKPLCVKHSVIFMIAGDIELALKIRADGVHLSQQQAKRISLINRRAFPEKWMMSISCHSARFVRNLDNLNPTFLLVSPVFPTLSHKGAKHLGIFEFTKICRLSPYPVFALGGITTQTLPRLKSTGLHGIAGIGTFTTLITPD